MNVIIQKVVADGEFKEPNVTLYRDVSLPAAPFPGLTIYADNWQETIESVSFNLDARLYIAKPKMAHCSPFKESVQEYLDMGWVKARPG